MSRNIDPWDLPDVPELLTAVSHVVELRAGADVIAVVDVSAERRLLGAEVLPTLAPVRTSYESWELARETLADVLARLCPSRFGPPTRTFHVVRCRDGRVVPTLDEAALGHTFLYAKNGIDAFMGSIITITPFGWREEDSRGARIPSLRTLAPPLRLAQ